MVGVLCLVLGMGCDGVSSRLIAPARDAELTAPAHIRAGLAVVRVSQQSCIQVQRSETGAGTGAKRSAGTPHSDQAAAPSECCTSACRSKSRQILGVDLRRWTFLGIIVILVILLVSLVARLRGAQPRALPQVQVQGGLSCFLLGF